MNHLIAKTKGIDGQFYKVMSTNSIYDIPENLSNSKEYESSYLLEDDEWFSLSKFSTYPFCLDLLKNNFNSTDYNQIPIEKYNNIEYLCSYQSRCYFFQRLTNAQIVKKKFFSISTAPELIKNKPIILINNIPDALYLKDSDTLYFQKLTTISKVFKGIDSLYREATQKETESFLSHNFILLNNGFTADFVQKANRKRITMVMDTLNTFSPNDYQCIFSYIRSYCDDLSYDEKASHFIISTEDELKKLLFGIEQRYYTTSVGNERRLANSISKI